MPVRILFDLSSFMQSQYSINRTGASRIKILRAGPEILANSDKVYYTKDKRRRLNQRPAKRKISGGYALC